MYIITNGFTVSQVYEMSGRQVKVHTFKRTAFFFNELFKLGNNTVSLDQVKNALSLAYDVPLDRVEQEFWRASRPNAPRPAVTFEAEPEPIDDSDGLPPSGAQAALLAKIKKRAPGGQ